MDKATPTPASVESVMAKAMMLVGALGDSCEAATSLPFLEAVTALRAEVERLAAQAASAPAVRMLTDDEQAAIIDMHSTGRAQGDHECAEAIQRKFCEVNKLPAPSDGEIGGA